MSNWPYLDKHRLKDRNSPYYSTPEDGFNGAFGLHMPGEARLVCVIASDGLGWQHVSVSFGQSSSRVPSWDVMCWVRDLFFEPEDWVIQFHPPLTEYVNNHAGCLHLWKCIDGRVQPTPPSELVGVKGKTPEDVRRELAV
jgi:hypothetical protein